MCKHSSKYTYTDPSIQNLHYLVPKITHAAKNGNLSLQMKK